MTDGDDKKKQEISLYVYSCPQTPPPAVFPLNFLSFLHLNHFVGITARMCHGYTCMKIHVITNLYCLVIQSGFIAASYSVGFGA